MKSPFFCVLGFLPLVVPIQSQSSRLLADLDNCSCDPFGNGNKYVSLFGGVVQLPINYNKNLEPPGHPTVVEIGFIVNDVLEIDDSTYSMTLKMEMPVFWNDSRIKLDIGLMNQSFANRWYYIDPAWKEDIWFPTLVVQNVQEFKTITSIKSNEKLMITHLPDHRFYYVAMHLIKFSCGLKFDYFPFDQHNCDMKVHLDSPIEHLRLGFFHGSHKKWGWANTTTILGYSIKFEPLTEAKLIQANTVFNGMSYNQSVSGFSVHITRKVSVFVFNYFIPSGLFVVVSWVSLIIPPDAVPGRVALIITTFLVLVNIANTVFSNSPTADTINPIQVWILACIVFVFMTVLEYAYILFMMRRVKKHILHQNNEKKNKPRKASKVYADEGQGATSSLHSAQTSHGPAPPIPEDEALDISKVKEFLRDIPVPQAGANSLTLIKSKFLAWRTHMRTAMNPLIEDFMDNFAQDEISLQLLMANTDFVFFWLMIVTFLVFNIGYWTYYTL